MTYKDHLASAMTEIGKNPKALFIGYGLSFDNAAAGTLAGVPKEQRIEMPLAENLMMSAAIGMSLEGFVPVVFFERFDFILNAMDAIVNHLDKIHALSNGEFSPACILRVVVGNREKPLFTGVTHTQDFTNSIHGMVSFPVVSLLYKETIHDIYARAHADVCAGRSWMVVEYKDRYDS